MTETTSESLAGLASHAAPLESLEIGDGAVERLAKLGAEAAGFEITTIFNEAEWPGLPTAIPIGIRRGDNPEAQSLAHLFEAWRVHPSRRRGTAEMLTLDSFIAHVKREHLPDETVIFADTNWAQPSFTAVIDYHFREENVAGWGQYRTLYRFPLSEPWKAWVAQNGKAMAQADFAAFLEDRLPELSSPTEAEAAAMRSLLDATVATPAELMKLSRGLQVNVDQKVKAVQTLQTGEAQVMFEESHLGADGQPLKVPGVFIVDVPPFFQGDSVRIPARLRYRVSGGAVSWFYQLYRPDLHITDRVRADLDIVRRETGLLALEGRPEVPPA